MSTRPLERLYLLWIAYLTGIILWDFSTGRFQAMSRDVVPPSLMLTALFLMPVVLIASWLLLRLALRGRQWAQWVFFAYVLYSAAGELRHGIKLTHLYANVPTPFRLWASTLVAVAAWGYFSVRAICLVALAERSSSEES